MLVLTAVVAALLPVTAHGQTSGFDPADACPVSVPEADFTDRDAIAPAHVRNVDCADAFDIVTGLDDGRFAPHLPVRRDQMASLIARTLDAAGLVLPPAEEGTQFTDVGENNPHRENIRRLAALGIVTGGPLGLPADQFGPALSTRRDQMASLLDRAATIAFLGLPPEGAQASTWSGASAVFSDVAPTSVHATTIDQAAAAGLVSGFDDGTFRPALSTRRDHAASFAVRLLRFLAVPAAVDLTDVPGPTIPVGETVTATATVLDQFGRPVTPDRCATEGEQVRFFNSRRCTVTVAVEGASPAEQTVEPDADGDATFTFSATGAGTITVSASIQGPGGLFVAADGDSDRATLVALPAP
ncbi:MAG: S-layer homology domain-containing protein [Egibacteraceae bacterium]